MLTKRIIPCLDVRAGKVTKGVSFQGNVDIGDPVVMARHYYEQGADEIVFYDITASNEKRDIMIDVVRRVAAEIFIPFSVGGGLRTLADMRTVLLAGAEKVSIDSGAVRNPTVLHEGADAFGNQCIVLSMQVRRVEVSGAIPSGFEIFIDQRLQVLEGPVAFGTGQRRGHVVDDDRLRTALGLRALAGIIDDEGVQVRQRA